MTTTSKIDDDGVDRPLLLVGDGKIGVRTTTPTMQRLVWDGRGQHDPSRTAARGSRCDS